METLSNKFELFKCQKNIADIKAHASDIQNYLAVRHLDKSSSNSSRFKAVH